MTSTQHIYTPEHGAPRVQFRWVEGSSGFSVHLPDPAGGFQPAPWLYQFYGTAHVTVASFPALCDEWYAARRHRIPTSERASHA